jgi:hypothetical protein
VRFGKPDDDTGTRSIYGRIKITDADLMDRRADALADSVCPDDPRTHGERRTEALGILAVGGDRLPCRCDKPDCPATGPDPRAAHIVIHVITNDPGNQNGPAEDDGGPGDGGPDDSGPDDGARPYGPEDSPDDGAGPHSAGAQGAGAEGAEPKDGAADPDSPDSAEAAAPERPQTPPPCASSTAVITGGGVIPAPLLSELRAMGATIAPVLNPIDLAAVPGYRPSTALQRFVRARDLTCCFPGCNRPAEYCDVDHTIPYGARGLTHPGNLKCLCRKHHLLKTFWNGPGGWRDEQLADGTIVWTTPTGRRKHVPPGSRVLFPDWNTTTPVPTTSTVAGPPVPGRELTMPLRARSRADQHRNTIRAERARNQQADLANPPPF